MPHLQTSPRSRLLEFLKSHAPYSIIETGIGFADLGLVTECSKVGHTIQGTLRQTDDLNETVSLTITSAQHIEAGCSCSTPEQMQEQWCPHAVAVLWRASDLGFLDTQSGFVASESLYRLNSSSPQEISALIGEISRLESSIAPAAAYAPRVRIVLDASKDRLGVQVLFENDIQTPALFEEFRRRSSRALDNILLQILDDAGTWDEDQKLWYINSSDGIELVLGLIQEYDIVLAHSGRKPISFSNHLLDAQLELLWLESGLELTMYWLLPDGSRRKKEGDLIGTGPHWTCLEGTLYRIASTASRIASIFPYGPSLNISATKVGPILEAFQTGLIDPVHIVVLQPELQPVGKVKTPRPCLELSRLEPDYGGGFDSNQPFVCEARLDFEYPNPPERSNIVYLPDREKEREYLDFLKSQGFEFSGDSRRAKISGDAALDLVNRGTASFPEGWKVTGLELIRKSIKFAELSVRVALASSNAADAKKAGSKIDWFDCQVSLTQNNAHVPLSIIFKSARTDQARWVRLDSGAYARIPGGNLSTLKTTLGTLDPNFKLSNTIKARLSTAQAISLSSVIDEQFNISTDEKLKSLASKLRNFEAIEPIPVSKRFKGKLRSYQKEGLTWLNFLNEFELGGVLADEMGLGKTVQTLAFLQHLKESKIRSKTKPAPTLVVAPTSVVTNWLYEARRFTPELNTTIYHGSRRKELLSKFSEFDIIITSYALLRLDRPELERHSFAYIILDEAQNIKNPDAATTKSAKSLRTQRRIALSGTPTENRPMELWSIMDFLMPGYLGSAEFFRNHIEKPILEGGPGVQVSKALNAKTRPFILRRTKAEVEKDLPAKIESSLHVAMTPSQMELYAQILEEVRPRVFDAIKNKGVRGASVSILAALLRLRQVCNHPNSIGSLREAPGYDSGKFNLLKDLVTEALENGRKILLFSQFRDMLAIIRSWLVETSVNYLYLDGATKNRRELIDQFNLDPAVRLFLISLKAGGTGLNLTAADTVIIYDPWWNPAVESQAVDRAHRIGQTKNVNVYRLVTENSIEQKIMDLKVKKAKIVDALINDNGLSTVSLSKADIESLFSPLSAESAALEV